MTRSVALVRGINVGGKMLRMDLLRSICEQIGLRDVQTVLQSGNVVFRGARAGARLEKDLEEAIRRGAGLDVRVMVRSAGELARVVEGNPFPEQAQDEPNRLIVVFLEKEPAADAVAALRSAYRGPEPMHLEGRELYIVYGEGMGRSKLTPALYERKLGVAGTARNWNTVRKLVELTTA